MKYFFLFTLIIIFSVNLAAQNFEDHFINKTLRLDYIFSGDTTSQQISVSELSQLPEWSSRKHNLSNLLREGNGQIIVTDVKTNECIYKESFSSLFQEWLTTPEASKTQRSFENTFLIPYPKEKINIEIILREKDGAYKSYIKHQVNPNDILIKKKDNSNRVKYTTIHEGDITRPNIQVVFLAEGYTKEQMQKFRQDAMTACEAILTHKAFNQYKDRFTFRAVESISNDSGVSVPKEGKWLDTAFGSHFDTFYSDRYLTTTNVKDIHDMIAGIPYTHIIILANTDVYGGGGIYNAYTLTTTRHPDFRPVVVHEFGHSFAGLADEYYYDNDIFDDTYNHNIEPWEPNITTLVNFSPKWKSLLKSETPIPTLEAKASEYPIGVYEGAGYSAKGIYKSAIDCRMRTNTCKDFCPACSDAIERLIKFYTE